jgi:hypothetical protein
MMGRAEAVIPSFDTLYSVAIRRAIPAMSGVRDVQRHAWTKSRDDLKSRAAAALELGSVELQRHPDRLTTRVTEVRRHDANDRIRLAIRANGLAQDLRVFPKPILPHRVAQHRDVPESRRFFVTAERTAELRSDLHYVEKLGADPCAIVALGFLGSADVDRALVKRRDPGEAPLLRAVIEIVVDWRRHPAEAARQVLSLDGDQFVGVGERHSLEHRSVHDAEHGRREADAER